MTVAIQAQSDRTLKVISSAGFIFLGLALVFININGVADGYETSVYEAFPGVVWVCLLAGVVIGFWISIHQIFAHNASRGKWWAVGLMIVLLGNLIILLLPILRGYALYGREDAMTQVGYAVDIVHNGFLSERDIYPIQHLLVATTSILTGLHPLDATGVVSAVLSIAYVGFLYCLSRLIFKAPRLYRLVTLSSTVLLFSPMQYHVSLVPTGFGVLLIPLIVYAFLHRLMQSSMQYGLVATLIIGLTLPLIHPLVWLAMCITLLIVAIMFHMLLSDKINLLSIRFAGLLISGVVFITWFFRFYLAEHLIRVVYNQFIGLDINLTMAEKVVQSAAKVGYEWLDVALLMGKVSGHDLIFLGISGLAIVIAVKRLIRLDSNMNDRLIVILTPLIIVPGLFFVLHMFATVVEFGIMRLVTTMVACAPIYVGYAINFAYEKYRHRQHQTGVLKVPVFATAIGCLLILIPWLIGLTSSFGWTYIKQANQQATQMEMVGVNWLVTHKSSSVSADVNRMVSRYSDALYGTEKSAETGIYRISDTTSPIGALPDHFGYSNDSMLGNSYSEDIYVPLSKYDKLFHEIFFPEFSQFDKSDFDALYVDKSANKVFDIGEFEVWYIDSLLRTRLEK